MMRTCIEIQNPDAVAPAGTQPSLDGTSEVYEMEDTDLHDRLQDVERCPPRDLSRTSFDYTKLEPTARRIAREAVTKIKARGKQAAQSIIGIGAELAKVKAALRHGHYRSWLKAEFGWSERQAQRALSVYERFGESDNLADLGELDLSALYLLAAPSTPEAVREAALEKAAAGVRVTHASVRTMLGTASQSRREALETMPEPEEDERQSIPEVEAVLGTSEGTVVSASAPLTAAPDLDEHVEADELTCDGTPLETAVRPEAREEEDDDTKVALEHLAYALRLVEYCKDREPQEVAGLIEPAQRDVAMREAERLADWLKDLSFFLSRV